MRSIEFNTWSMERLIRGAKTQTRRRMKPPPEKVGGLWRWKNTAWCEGRALVSDVAPVDLCPYGKVGDERWVKEALEKSRYMGMTIATYAADGHIVRPPLHWRWKLRTIPTRFCPREASRFTIELTDVRVERVQDITESDAIREGCLYAGHDQSDDWNRPDAYSTVWRDIYGDEGWARNDWVWVLGFKLLPPGDLKNTYGLGLMEEFK